MQRIFDHIFAYFDLLLPIGSDEINKRLQMWLNNPQYGHNEGEKSRIRETKHLSTDADSSTDAIGGWTKAKSAKKKLFLHGDFRPLPNKNVQMLDHFFPLLFPKDSKSLKILDIRLWEKGAKRPLNGTSKMEKSEKKNFFCLAI